MIANGSRLLDRSRLGLVLIVFGVALGGMALGLSIQKQHSEPKMPPGALTSRSAPSSVKISPKVIASYSVPAADPKYISIAPIGVENTQILKLGLTGSGAIAVPNNIYATGWYDGSSRPGQAGAMFIYGHVSSWTANGIFYNLKKLQAGDKVVITRGDNTTYTYKVIKSVVYPYNAVPMNTVLAPVNGGTPGLNLMTCTGQVIKGTSEFNERLVVYTSLVAS